MPSAKATFVTGVNRRVPTPPFPPGPSEGIMRLAFHVQDENGVLPTIVTRESGPVGEPTHIPQQVFLVAPLANIAFASAYNEAAKADDSHRRRAVVPAPAPHIDVAGVSLTGYAPGYKDRNQDAALLMDTYLSNRQQLLAVFDGHGPDGHRVSDFARRNLPFTLLAQLLEEGSPSSAQTGKDASRGGETRTSRAMSAGAASAGTSSCQPTPTAGPAAGRVTSSLCSGADGEADGCGGGPLSRALWRTVSSLDHQLEDSGIDVINSGATAALCHVHGRRVTAAWVGDSRMLLGLRSRGAGAQQQQQQQQQQHPRAGARGLRGEGSTASGDDRASTGNPPETHTTSGGDSGGSDGGNRRGGSSGGWWVAWSSTDHKPELPGEAQRIQAAGGRVARSVGRQGPVGPYRVWFQDQPYPGLAMSRALGDLPGRHIGVTCTPSCANLRLPDSGPAVLVLASDGVWELLSNEQVLDLAGSAGSAAEAASRLVQQSRRAWVKEYGGSYVDDITAVVMRFDMPPQGHAGAAGTGEAEHAADR